MIFDVHTTQLWPAQNVPEPARDQKGEAQTPLSVTSRTKKWNWVVISWVDSRKKQTFADSLSLTGSDPEVLGWIAQWPKSL